MSNGKTIPLPGYAGRLGGRGGYHRRVGLVEEAGEPHAVAALPAGLGGNASASRVLPGSPARVAVTIRYSAIAAGRTVVTSFSVVPQAPREQRAIRAHHRYRQSRAG